MGALDVDAVDQRLAAILPDTVTHDTVAEAFASSSVTFSAAVARDNGSVWLVNPRALRVGGVLIAPEETGPPDALRLIDSNAFGTGHHPTTALCLEAIADILQFGRPESLLDVGTGSGILALAALRMGVPQAVGIDIDAGSLQAAAENARLNHLENRIRLMHGGPDSVDGCWPLVVANVLAAPLIDMAPVLVRRLASRGRMVLSGIPRSLESDVRRAYEHLGIRQFDSKTRAGWTMLTAQASW